MTSELLLLMKKVLKNWAVLTKRFIGNDQGQMTHVETVDQMGGPDSIQI